MMLRIVKKSTDNGLCPPIVPDGTYFELKIERLKLKVSFQFSIFNYPWGGAGEVFVTPPAAMNRDCNPNHHIFLTIGSWPLAFGFWLLSSFVYITYKVEVCFNGCDFFAVSREL